MHDNDPEVDISRSSNPSLVNSTDSGICVGSGKREAPEFGPSPLSDFVAPRPFTWLERDSGLGVRGSRQGINLALSAPVASYPSYV